MSTDALWRALEVVFDHPNADGETCRAARDELLALEKACQTLADWGVVNEMLKSKEAEVLQCGADYETAPDEDMGLADGKHPELGEGRTPCPGCYPEEYD